MNSISKFFTVLCTIIIVLLAACSFDEGGLPADDGDAGVEETSCDTHDECEGVGYACNEYRCLDNVCQPVDNYCAEGLLCTADGCVEEGVSECSADTECEVPRGCDIATCYDGVCEAWPTGCADTSTPECTHDNDCASNEVCDDGVCEVAPECTFDGDCASNEVCNSSGVCEDAPECTVDADCPDHAWSCYEADCRSDDTCRFVDTCSSGFHCTSSGCVENSASDHGIDCDVNGSDLKITITGYILQALATEPVTPDGDFLKIGGDPHGWGDYTHLEATTERPVTSWTGDTNGDGTPKTYVIDVPSTWTSFNFWLSRPGDSDRYWFDLSKYTVTGDCVMGSGEVLVN